MSVVARSVVLAPLALRAPGTLNAGRGAKARRAAEVRLPRLPSRYCFQRSRPTTSLLDVMRIASMVRCIRFV